MCFEQILNDSQSPRKPNIFILKGVAMKCIFSKPAEQKFINLYEN